MSEHEITLTVDGTEAELTVEARTLLVHALRDDLGCTAPKVGCESGTCGACTVHVDGEAVKSCTVLAVQADGGEVTTAAGLADLAGVADGGDGNTDVDAADHGDAGDLHPVQAAFHEEHGLQCGYCTPGMVMTATDLLSETPDPSREEIRTALKGNVCRCTGYHNVVDAVEAAAEKLADGDGTMADAEGTMADAEGTMTDGGYDDATASTATDVGPATGGSRAGEDPADGEGR